MRLVSLTLAVLLLVLAALVASAKPLVIVVTFPSLVPDVKSLVCSDDKVLSIVPRGVDPHRYQLRPGDVDVLKKANIIISTGHAPFEARIEELVEQGMIHAKLIVIWRVPGIRLLDNPVTRKPNLHMPIYDPRNYLVFMEYLERVLATLRPECSRVYASNLENIAKKLRELIKNAPQLNVDAVADMPVVMYAVDWLGIHVKSLIVPEPGLPTTPELYRRAEELLARGAYAVVMTPSKAKASVDLLEMAERYKAPVIYVPSPLEYKPIPEKLEYIVEQVENASLAHRALPTTTLLGYAPMRWVLVTLFSSLAFGALSALVAARRMYFLAAGLPHASLVAALLAIPVSLTVGLEPFWAALFSVALILAFAYLIERGVDPDIAASVYVSAAASASVALMYYILEKYTVTVDIWAFILGDPLLVTPSDVVVTVVVGILVLTVGLLIYREEVCIGIESETVRLAGIRVKAYDAILVSILAVASVLLLRSIGFVVEHVMLLLPGVIAVTLGRGLWRTLAVSILTALAAGLGGLALALSTGLAPAALIGGLLVIIYVAALLVSR